MMRVGSEISMHYNKIVHVRLFRKIIKITLEIPMLDIPSNFIFPSSLISLLFFIKSLILKCAENIIYVNGQNIYDC